MLVGAGMIPVPTLVTAVAPETGTGVALGAVTEAGLGEVDDLLDYE